MKSHVDVWLCKSREAPGTNRNTRSTLCVYLCLGVSVCVRSGPHLAHVQSHNLHATVPSCFPLSTSSGSPPPRHPATADRVWQQMDWMEKNGIPRKKWRKRERELTLNVVFGVYLQAQGCVLKRLSQQSDKRERPPLASLSEGARGAPCACTYVCVCCQVCSSFIPWDELKPLFWICVCVATPLWKKRATPFSCPFWQNYSRTMECPAGFTPLADVLLPLYVLEIDGHVLPLWMNVNTAISSRCLLPWRRGTQSWCHHTLSTACGCFSFFFFSSFATLCFSLLLSPFPEQLSAITFP